MSFKNQTATKYCVKLCFNNLNSGLNSWSKSEQKLKAKSSRNGSRKSKETEAVGGRCFGYCYCRRGQSRRGHCWRIGGEAWANTSRYVSHFYILKTAKLIKLYTSQQQKIYEHVFYTSF